MNMDYPSLLEACEPATELDVPNAARQFLAALEG